MSFRTWLDAGDDGPNQFAWLDRTDHWPAPLQALAIIVGVPLTWLATLVICVGTCTAIVVGVYYLLFVIL
jgi:hypothetical protein